VLKKSLSLKNCQNWGIENVQATRENSFIAHPDAILFSRFFREGVFQQLRLVTTFNVADCAIESNLFNHAPIHSGAVAERVEADHE
jgi:hypothetical protein